MSLTDKRDWTQERVPGCISVLESGGLLVVAGPLMVVNKETFVLEGMGGGHGLQP